MLCEDVAVSEEERLYAQSDLFMLLKMPKAKPALTVSMDQIQKFVKCSIRFNRSVAYASEQAVLQVALTTLPESPSLPLRFSKILIKFAPASYPPLLIIDSGTPDSTGPSARYRCLRWQDIQLIKCDELPVCATRQLGSEVVQVTADLNVFKALTKVFEKTLTLAEHSSVEGCARLACVR